MRAAVYYNNNDVRLEDVPKPSAGPGELVMKIMASGICGSDVLEWYRIKKAPIILGHEVAGIVEEVGEGVEKFKAGDRITVTHHVPCNKCRYCLSGNHTVCDTLHTTNFFPGGFTEYVRIPKLNVEIGTFKLPDGMSFEDGTFVEPLGCVVRGQRKANIQPWQTVLIIGSGISGLLHILLARAKGVERIIATDISGYKLEKAKEFGADFVIHASEDVPARVRECNEGRPADVVIVCAGAFSAFQQALDSVDRAGTVLCFATTLPDVMLPIPVNSFWRNSVTVMTSYAAAPVDLSEAVDLIGSKRIVVDQMITHRLSLEEAGLGFKLTASGENSMKVVIEPHGRC